MLTNVNRNGKRIQILIWVVELVIGEKMLFQFIELFDTLKPIKLTVRRHLHLIAAAAKTESDQTRTNAKEKESEMSERYRKFSLNVANIENDGWAHTKSTRSKMPIPQHSRNPVLSVSCVGGWINIAISWEEKKIWKYMSHIFGRRLGSRPSLPLFSHRRMNSQRKKTREAEKRALNKFRLKTLLIANSWAFFLAFSECSMRNGKLFFVQIFGFWFRDYNLNFLCPWLRSNNGRAAKNACTKATMCCFNLSCCDFEPTNIEFP